MSPPAASLPVAEERVHEYASPFETIRDEYHWMRNKEDEKVSVYVCDVYPEAVACAGVSVEFV